MLEAGADCHWPAKAFSRGDNPARSILGPLEEGHLLFTNLRAPARPLWREGSVDPLRDLA